MEVTLSAEDEYKAKDAWKQSLEQKWSAKLKMCGHNVKNREECIAEGA